MAGTGEAGKRGSRVRSDCWIEVEIRDSGGVSIDLQSKVSDMFGERIGALLEEGCRALGVDHAGINLEDQGAYTVHLGPPVWKPPCAAPASKLPENSCCR